MKTVTFFNSGGGIGSTTLLYHAAHMLAALGHKVLVADLDPQAHATGMMLSDSDIEEIWAAPEDQRYTIFGFLNPIVHGVGDIREPNVREIAENFFLLPGDLGLSTFEDRLSEAWPKCQLGDEAAFRATMAMRRIIDRAANHCGASMVFIDVGPNLGAINRAALISSDFVVVPVAPDLFSVKGLQNLGPALRQWRKTWSEAVLNCPESSIALPVESMRVLGYVVLQHGMRDNRPPKAYQRWMDRIPDVFREAVLMAPKEGIAVSEDPWRLSTIKHYRSLIPMAMEARKPVFELTPSDGAIGAHSEAVSRARSDFERLAAKILDLLELGE